jgi:hypothetical protein
MNTISYKICKGRIHCGICDASYKINKDGTPIAFFKKHLINVHNYNEDEYQEFIKTYNLNHKSNINICKTSPPPQINQVSPLIVNEVLNEKNINDECPICFEPMYSSDICPIPCHHKFHTKCIKQLENDNCPLCRNSMGINLIENSRQNIEFNELHILQRERLEDEEQENIRRIEELRNRIHEIRIETERQLIMMIDQNERLRPLEETPQHRRPFHNTLSRINRYIRALFT